MRSTAGKIIVIVVLLAAIVGVLSKKSRRQDAPAPSETGNTGQSAAQVPERTAPKITPGKGEYGAAGQRRFTTARSQYTIGQTASAETGATRASRATTKGAARQSAGTTAPAGTGGGQVRAV